LFTDVRRNASTTITTTTATAAATERIRKQVEKETN